MFKDSEVKYHVKESFIDVFKKDDVEDELVKMLIAASTNKLFLSSLGDSIEISLLGLLKNKEFVEKLKFFAFYLMQNEQEENIKKHVKYIEK